MTQTVENKEAMQDLITCSIDDIEIQVPKGTLIIRAAEKLGTFIPRFCDHPALAPVAACRMCLVEIEGMPKPQPSCAVTLTEGMKVRTQLTSEIAKGAQEGVMEFLLINHPLDCPVCDKGGECPLQNQAMSNGRPDSRFEIDKRIFEKPIELSTEVLLDRERCVECARCTRFSEEVAGDKFIDLLERGAKQQIGIAEDEPFNSYFSGNTIQICPVGALTSSAYRFRSRPFDLVSAQTTCEHCAAGCSLRTDYRRETVMRRLAWEDKNVNEEWNCDKGRFAFTYLKNQRVNRSRVLNQDALLPDAVEFAAKELQKYQGQIGVLTGGRLTLEDAWSYSKFARVVLGTNNIDFRNRPHSKEEEEFLAHSVAGGVIGATYKDIEKAPSVLLVNFEPEEESPIVFLRLRKAVRNNQTKVFAVTSLVTKGLKKLNSQNILIRPGDETKLINDALAQWSNNPDKLVEKLHNQISKPGSIIFVGERAAVIPGLLTALIKFAEATGAKLSWIPRRAGERGAVEVGLLPNLLPGGRLVKNKDSIAELAAVWGVEAKEIPQNTGLNAEEIVEAAIAGKIKALVIAGMELKDYPNPTRLNAALEKVEFILALSVNHNDLTQKADVLLPVAGVTEKSGTFVNWEGRPRPFGKAMTQNKALSDSRVLAFLAEAMGHNFGPQTTADIRNDLSALGVSDLGEAKAPDFDAKVIPSLADNQLLLSTFNQLIDDGALQAAEPHLAGTRRGTVAKISASTASRLQLAAGEAVTISNADGAITLPIEIAEVAEFVVWLPTNSEPSQVRQVLNACDGSVVTLSKGVLT
ncbi:MAG: NADH-quinone oxidoreductase [Actinomycetota bacterium]|jgi:NADH-quinone oxidoreductase subunit G